jgi:hypothetical protein
MSQHFLYWASPISYRALILWGSHSSSVCPSGKSSFKKMVSTENWWHGTDCRGKAVRAPLTGLGQKVMAWATARPSRPEIHLQSDHKSPCLRMSSSCHDTNSNFRRSHDAAIFFSIQVSITVLIWTRLRHDLFHSCPSYPAILQRTVHQHILLLQVDNTLPIERTWDGHGVSSSKSRFNDTKNHFGYCEREIFPTPPSNSCRHKRRRAHLTHEVV